MTDPLQLGCLCSLDDNENIIVYRRACPLHSDLSTEEKVIIQRWCSGSSEAVMAPMGKTGRCRICMNNVPQKYGVAAVHLPDGSTPRA